MAARGRGVVSRKRANHGGEYVQGVLTTELYKVIALIYPEDGYAKDGAGEDILSVYDGTR
jgi:hypothetical protein